MKVNGQNESTMDEIDKNWIHSIIAKAESRLGRSLEENERMALSKIRSFIAYEMIEDTFDNLTLTQEQIVHYVASIANEG